ncbi:MAG TPA: terminase TerL endonuclease subunit [Yoonia sp.]|nr:terminase TerL endonuclease subunit [Yoonia sp.]
MVLRDWQKAEIAKIYDNPAGTRRAIVSFGRKNGKTALASFLLLLHLCGPMMRRNSQLYSAAQSREQAAILFGLAAKIVRMSPDLSAVITVRDTKKELVCTELGTVYRALSAEASTAYGLSPVFVVHDELGQVKGPRSELYDALETASAAHDNPLSIIISTQAATDGDLLSLLIDDARTKADKRVVLSMYSAPEDADPFSEQTIKLANPAYGDFQNSDEVKAMAATAKRLPSAEASFRNLILNQRVEARNPFVSRKVWDANGASRELDGLVYGGLDLSTVNDLTALVLVDSNYAVHCEFWLPEHGIAEKSQKDRVPYDVWAEQGHLILTPGKSIEYEWVAHRLRELFDDHDIKALAFDRWGMKHLQPWLIKAGFSEHEVDKFAPFGQGFRDMSPALRELESVLLNEKMAHNMHPVLRMCAANAVVQQDPAGNRKLAKDKSSGRIDGMVALAMAVGAMAKLSDEPEVVDLDAFLNDPIIASY